MQNDDSKLSCMILKLKQYMNRLMSLNMRNHTSSVFDKTRGGRRMIRLRVIVALLFVFVSFQHMHIHLSLLYF